MAGKGNKGFGAAMAEGLGALAPEAHSPARDVLESRSGTLSQLATGKLVTDRTEWVNPARCRPWALHNRATDLLDEASCADLIDSLKAEGRQRIPAIVRRLRDGGEQDYEIIAGVRRWWSISWLRAHNYPDFHYLVTVQTVTDEEGFRLADVENRARRDISDLERARDYLRALDLFYGGSQTAMAARLNVSNGWMSRILEVGRLPAAIVEAFPDSRAITARHAGQLAPSLKARATRERMIEAATRLTEQRRAGARLEPHRIVATLLEAAKGRTKAAPAPVEIHSPEGKTLLRVERSGKAVTVRLLATERQDREALGTALMAVVDHHL